METSSAAESSVAKVEEEECRAKVTRGDLTWDLSYVWLRDHCRCEECYNASTFQRLLDTVSIPLDIRPASISCSADGLTVKWQDGHLTELPWTWLEEFAPLSSPKPAMPTMSKDAGMQRVFWDGDGLQRALPPDVPFQEFMETEAGLKDAVERFYKWGVVFIQGNQANTEDLARAANRFSRLQETFYGGVCVVAAENEIDDIGYSSVALQCHTDTTYFHEPNGGLLFSCFKHDGEGGDNPLVDGFYAADKLRREHPEHYEALCTIPLAMHYVDKTLHIETHATMIKRDPITGDIQMIRFNNNDRAPLSHLSAADIDRYYAANKAFATILRSASSQYVVKLTPRRIMIIDNWRLLHGRVGFTGHRVMASVYLQRDEINSKIRRMLGVKV